MNATTEKKTAGELANQALSDQTIYKAMEVALAATEAIEDEIEKSILLYQDKIEQDEFCVCYVIASDPIIPNLMRRKFYCWPWLPSPRPDQTVFLYNKVLGKITKRLWVLPPPNVMAEISEPGLVVDNSYQTMQQWSKAFFNGCFWDFIRKQHDITMLSQEEWMNLNKDEIIKARQDDPDFLSPKPFDFSKVGTNQVTDS